MWWTSDIYIYIYAFSRRFYPKRLTIAFRLYIMCSLGIEPTTFCAADAMLYHWATQEQQKSSGVWTELAKSTGWYSKAINYYVQHSDVIE